MLRDVQKTAKNFTLEKQEQWATLAEFHRLYRTSDTVPDFPINITSPQGQKSYAMEYGPCSWTSGWSKLAFRFPRPGHPYAPSAQQPMDGQRVGGLAGGSAPVAAAQPAAFRKHGPPPSSPTQRAQWLVSQNRVTGEGAPEGQQRIAQTNAERETFARHMTLKIDPKNLQPAHKYFIVLEKEVNEGQLQVGLGEFIKFTGGNNTHAEIKWFARKKWLKSYQSKWLDLAKNGTPLPTRFLLAKQSGSRNAWVTSEPVDQIISYLPECTPKSVATAPSLTAANVLQLIAICQAHNLVRASTAEAESGSDGEGVWSKSETEESDEGEEGEEQQEGEEGENRQGDIGGGGQEQDEDGDVQPSTRVCRSSTRLHKVPRVYHKRNP